MKHYRVRRFVAVVIFLAFTAFTMVANDSFQSFVPITKPTTEKGNDTLSMLESLAVKGRAPKTGYEREQFGDGWDSYLGCDTRNRILRRDLKNPVVNFECKVVSGVLHDPYGGKTVSFVRGETTSDDVQIDHVVALSNAWQTGAQQLSYTQRVMFANDPLNLLAVDGTLNQQKADGDAATWLPPNKPFRCEYVRRQVLVKRNYELWVTPAEQEAIRRVLASC